MQVSSANSTNGLNGDQITGDGLSTNKDDTVSTGRYDIEFSENNVKIYDRQTSTWVKAWGDPHLTTGDGDHAQFQENMTIDLPDGTKVTFQTTEKDANGIALIDSVAITKGSEAVVVDGISDGQAGVKMGSVLNNADVVDRQFADGTVLRAGRKVDDLTFASDGKEIVGNDPNARFQEHMIDGNGGFSRFGFEDPRLGETGSGGGSIFDRLQALIAKFGDRLEKQLSDLEDETNKADVPVLDTDGKPVLDDAGNPKMKPAISEEKQREAFQNIQRLRDIMNELVSMSTGIQANEHQTNQSIIQNFAA